MQLVFDDTRSSGMVHALDINTYVSQSHGLRPAAVVLMHVELRPYGWRIRDQTVISIRT